MPDDDEERFREFVLQQWGPLTRTAYLLTGDRGAAEDLVQSALEKTHRRWGRILRKDAPGAYVRRAMINTAVSWRRCRRTIEVPLLDADTIATPDAYQHAENRHQLLGALRRLPPRMRAVLVLRYFEDLSEADIARLLDCSPGTVKSQASRGLARLRADLEPPPTITETSLQEDPA